MELPVRWAAFIIGVVLMIGALASSKSMIEQLDANEIMVIQSVSGRLTWYTEPGIYSQWFGKTTHFPRRREKKFEIPVRFNDNGHGTIYGSLQYELPLDSDTLNKLFRSYPSIEAIDSELIERVLSKSTYMTGPLMSSRESASERRNQLLSFIEDQIIGGVYQTRQEDTLVEDPITNAKRVVMVVKLVLDKDGKIMRQERPVLPDFGVKTYNFSIYNIKYDDTVEAQIRQQQQIIMNVQTAMAESKQAEQRKLTVESQGAADAAKAKWDQEVIKARVTTQALQEKEVAETEATKRVNVAKLDADAAEQYKREKLLRATADAAYKSQILQADGALEVKTKALIEINNVWASAWSSYKGNVVPQVVMGGGAGQAAPNSLTAMMDLISTKAARDLAADLSIGATAK